MAERSHRRCRVAPSPAERERVGLGVGVRVRAAGPTLTLPALTRRAPSLFHFGGEGILTLTFIA
jgi:hypothetical protein